MKKLSRKTKIARKRRLLHNNIDKNSNIVIFGRSWYERDYEYSSGLIKPTIPAMQQQLKSPFLPDVM